MGQAALRDTSFEFADWSLKKRLTGDWKAKIVPRIRSVAQIVVICGHYTNRAVGVSAEVKIAQEEGTPYFLLAGRAKGVNQRPVSALSTDKMYKWTWENLAALIAGAR